MAALGLSGLGEGSSGVTNRTEKAVNEAEWDRVKTRLKQEFGETAFKSWVKPITPTAIHDGEVELAVPTRFMRDWIATHYGERIRALWSGENPSVRRIILKVAGSSSGSNGRGTAVTERTAPAAAKSAEPMRAAARISAASPQASRPERPLSALSAGEMSRGRS